MNAEQKANNYAHNYFDMHESNSYKMLKQGYLKGYSDGAKEFLHWLFDHPLDFQFGSKNYLIGLDMKNYSIDELYKIFENE